jgi:hypothetical protein
VSRRRAAAISIFIADLAIALGGFIEAIGLTRAP